MWISLVLLNKMGSIDHAPGFNSFFMKKEILLYSEYTLNTYCLFLEPLFQKISGNHDYGDYVPWESEAKKKENMNHLLSYLNDMGFQVLLNESKPLKNDKDEIALIGVENWGAS